VLVQYQHYSLLGLLKANNVLIVHARLIGIDDDDSLKKIKKKSEVSHRKSLLQDGRDIGKLLLSVRASAGQSHQRRRIGIGISKSVVRSTSGYVIMAGSGAIAYNVYNQE